MADEHLTLYMNTRIGAVAQFSNYNFRSFVNFNGVNLAAGTDGIFELESDDQDNGVNIDAWFMPLLTDFGIDRVKHIRRVILGYESDGQLIMTATPDEGAPRIYVFPSNSNTELQGGISKTMDRDQKGLYWTLKIGNVNGCDFSVDSIKVIPVTLARRYVKR